jgi:hypothetical protein
MSPVHSKGPTTATTKNTQQHRTNDNESQVVKEEKLKIKNENETNTDENRK